MSNVMLAGRNYNLLRGTILAGGTLSAEIDLMEFSLIGVIANTNMVNSTLTAYVSAYSDLDSVNAANWVAVKDNSGNALTWGPLANMFALSSEKLAFLAPYRYIKIGSAVAQTNGVLLLLPVKA